MNLLDSTGRLYAARCPGCRAVHWRETLNHVRVCGQCGMQWPYVERYMLKGEVQRTPRRTDFADGISTWMQVGTVMRSMITDPEFHWDYKLLVAHVMGTKPERMEETMLAHYPDAPGPWSRRSLFSRYKRARVELQKRLEKAEVRV